MTTWMTIEQVARLMADDHDNIVQFVIEDRVPYRYHPDGIEIWFEGFQMVIPELYDLESDLNEIQAEVEAVMQRIIENHGPEKFHEIMDALLGRERG